MVNVYGSDFWCYGGWTVAGVRMATNYSGAIKGVSTECNICFLYLKIIVLAYSYQI